MERELALRGLVARWDRLTPEQRQARMASIELARAVRNGDDLDAALDHACAMVAAVVRRSA